MAFIGFDLPTRALLTVAFLTASGVAPGCKLKFHEQAETPGVQSAAQKRPSPSTGPVGGRFFDLKKVDAHMHVAPGMEKNALRIMDQAGVAVGFNLSADPRPRAVAAAWARSKRVGCRLIPFVGVDWRLPINRAFGKAAAHALKRAHEAGARGVKIPKALGLGIADPSGQRLAVDDVRLAPVFEEAGRLGMPVFIHVGDPVAFWEKPDKNNERIDELRLNPQWSNHAVPGMPSHAQLMAEQRRLFERHPKTRFVAVHVAGFPENLDWVDALLTDLPNVSVDLAARIPEVGRHPPAKVRDFFERHRKRILFGTDFGLSPDGIMLGAPLAWKETADDIAHFFRSTFRYLETTDPSFAHPTPIQGRWAISGIGLQRAILEDVYRGNAARMVAFNPDKPCALAPEVPENP
jgi:predicted TIM-barrel fold metal-dependent hydrolase